MPALNIKPSTDKQTLQDFWRASRAYPRESFLAALTPLPSLGLGVGVPFFIGKILGSLIHPDANVQPLIIGFIIVGLLTVLINYISFTSLFSLQPKVMADLQAKTLEALLRRSVGFHNNHISGKTVSDAVDYPTAYLQLSNTLFVDILPFVLVMVIGVILIAFSSPLLSLVVLAMTVITVALAAYFRHRMAPYRQRRKIAGKAVTAHLGDTITNHQTVISFGREDREQKRHAELARELFDTRTHDWHQIAIDGVNRIIGLLIFELLFILLIIHQVHHDPHLLATGIFAFSYTVTLSNRLFQIGPMMRAIEEAFLLAEPMTETLHETTEIQDDPKARPLEVSEGLIAFKDVTFAYADNANAGKVFSDFNLMIKPGEKIGLVGPSGGGKSSLTKLLLRFEDTTSGSITIDDQDIKQVTQQSLRQAIAYVPQEPLLFHRSICENIAYGQPHTTDEAIADAIQKAHATEFIANLPQGLDTIVGERGVKLSGGQRQRIAIARAILKDAPILVLDEATSALDSESEKAIQEALSQLMEDRTTIVIAHRLSTIQKMDRIVVLDKGAITEQGTHQELLSKHGLYAKLWQHQSGGFIEE